MQRYEDGGVVISCDFCGTDWDELLPMIEGHHGSVLCLECFKLALKAAAPADGPYACTLCLREKVPATLPRWRPEPLPDRANPQAVICQECILQAAKAFDRDEEVDWRWER